MFVKSVIVFGYLWIVLGVLVYIYLQFSKSLSFGSSNINFSMVFESYLESVIGLEINSLIFIGFLIISLAATLNLM